MLNPITPLKDTPPGPASEEDYEISYFEILSISVFSISVRINEATTMKKLLTSAPILQQAEEAVPFIIRTDASGYAIGAVLSQGEKENWATTLIHEVFVRYVIPRRIISDDGTQFISAVMQKVTSASILDMCWHRYITQKPAL